MEKKKLNKSNILNLIEEEANFILKKEEFHNKITQINEDIKSLYENRDFVGTFGFEGDNKSKSVSGFVDTPNISYIAQLEKDFAAQDAKDEVSTINEDELNEMDELKKENNNLKKQIEEISAFMSEMKKTDKQLAEGVNELFGLFGKKKDSSNDDYDRYDVYGKSGSSGARHLGGGATEEEARENTKDDRRSFYNNFKDVTFSMTKNDKKYKNL